MKIETIEKALDFTAIALIILSSVFLIMATVFALGKTGV